MKFNRSRGRRGGRRGRNRNSGTIRIARGGLRLT